VGEAPHKFVRGEESFKMAKPKLPSLNDALKQYIIFRQELKSNDDYFKAFSNIISVYKHFGGTLTHGTTFDAEIADMVAAAFTAGEDVAVAKIRAIAVIRDKVLATVLIKQSGTKYATLRRDLANAYTLCGDKYPCDLTNVLGILNA
jgi:hypothetical protein